MWLCNRYAFFSHGSHDAELVPNPFFMSWLKISSNYNSRQFTILFNGLIEHEFVLGYPDIFLFFLNLVLAPI